MNGNGNRRLRNFFWVCAVHKASQRPIVQGPHNTYEEANQFGFLHVKDGDFKVYEFPTRNKETARDMFKSKRLEETGMLEGVFKRAMYKV